MEIPPSLKPWLERLGINTTQLQWRLYQREKKRAQGSQQSRLPTSLQWLKYPHKFCLKCNAINNREDKRCTACGARLPSMLGYRLFRILGVAFPESSNPVTFGFLGIIMVLFVLGIVRDGFTLQAAFSPSEQTMAIFGMYRPAYTLKYGEVWRMLSFGLLHFGLLHLFFNCFALSQVGPIIESAIGRLRMLVLITITQIAAAVASHIWYFEISRSPYASTVGASGWLFGLIGYGVGGAGNLGSHGFMLRKTLIQWAIYCFLFGLLMGANNAAHAGGFIGGYLLGLIPIRQVAHRTKWNGFWTTAAVISVLLWAVTLGFMARSIVVFWNLEP